MQQQVPPNYSPPIYLARTVKMLKFLIGIISFACVGNSGFAILDSIIGKNYSILLWTGCLI